MSEVLVGTAYWLAQLRYEQFTQGVSAVEQQIKRLQGLAKAPIVATVGAGGISAGTGAASDPARQASGYQQLQRAQAALEVQQARLARSRGQDAQAANLESAAIQRLSGLLQAQNTTTVQTIGIQRQLVSTQQQVERAARSASSSFVTQGVDAFKQGLLGIVGPAALVAAGLGLATRAVQSFGDAFQFKAQLDAVNLGIQTNLQGVRASGQVFAEAQQFADRYRLTQKETADILASSTDILRVSTSSVGDLESALLRLQSRDVSKPVSEAARALRELNSGDVTSIKELFNVPAREALRMKNEIAGGADAVQVLNDYLDRAGVGMGVLENRAKGAAGAMRDQQIAQEKLALAQAKFAEGPGVAITKLQTTGLETLTADLSGKGDLAAANRTFLQALIQTGDFTAALDARSQALNATIGQTSTVTAGAADTMEAYRAIEQAAIAAAGQQRDGLAELHNTIQQSAEASLKDAAQKDLQQQKTALLAAQTQQAIDGFLRLNPGIDASAAVSLAAAQGYSPQIQQLIAMRIESDNTAAALGRLNIAQNIAAGAAGRNAGGLFLGGLTNTTGGIAKGLGAGAGQVSGQVLRDQETLQASRDALALSRAKTRAERIAIYERQLARQTTEEGRNRILAQIEGERSGGAGRISAAQNTALQLANVEQNSGLQLERIQRENLERLRDQQEDFDVKRTRSREDYERQRLRLLAQGQRAQAERLREDFERDQRREQEDFDRQRRRTLRNNAEGLGDTTARADLRTSQIQDRAALRGVAVSGQRRPDLGEAPPQLTGAAGGAGGGRGLFTLQVQIAPQPIVLDGKVIGEATWPTIEQLVDAELAAELGTIGIVLPPGGGNAAIAGARP